MDSEGLFFVGMTFAILFDSEKTLMVRGLFSGPEIDKKGKKSEFKINFILLKSRAGKRTFSPYYFI
ncbi:hypothetical protein DCMF_26960 [Candidatus Formimonas warabiya]|uniref:Uncharacterized protein n=1 Tax=Formimonas warabiya TaxID=1761012 RepID=A0A3G1KZR9_FORW1|nr:hypothetical protein DCMF_26960 [Candidatus Formimonas warabiya]